MNERSVLDPVRPNVVRRRIIELKKPESESEDEGPPSSVDVSRALASLRGPDLERLEAIMREDDERESSR